MWKDFDSQQAIFEATMQNIMEKLTNRVLQDLKEE